MSGGKGGKQKTTVELPPAIEEAAKDNLALAKSVGSLPYAPYFGPSVAAFTPAQHAAFAGADEASSAFGLPGGAVGAMPKPMNVGGFKGYSTEGLYNQGMAKVDPKVLELYKSFFYPNNGQAAAASGGGGGGGRGSGKGGSSPSNGVPSSFIADANSRSFK